MHSLLCPDGLDRCTIVWPKWEAHCFIGQGLCSIHLGIIMPPNFFLQ